ncbi:LysR substrate-binding domain-containing protein [Marinomonas primoryensis]|jgi:DNA-binding transcriptional LysR family regulator|uniref:LysR substrate-binding domain-containing protein n=1 Tax=Marinomonas primoryensis TaxID=178399 RepID=A0ABV0L4Z7_9GAMM|tara:strand:- start:1240 stop:2133 length:894 start_codon:yes stop_codon:yes gene_type:complete
MKHQQIRGLVQIADNGSIRAAARNMGISQSALTRTMRELEIDLGAELFQRSYRGVSFTLAGEALLRRARLVLETLESARDEIKQIAGGRGGRVRVGLTPVTMVTFFPSIYRQFTQALPDASLSLKEGLLTGIIPDLLEGRLDFGVAIAASTQLPSELSFTPMVSIRSCVAGREEHPMAHSHDWPKLLQQRWVLNLSQGSSSNLFLTWLTQQNLPRPANIVECSSPFLMLEMMRRTDLIGYGPARLFDDPYCGNAVQTFDILPQPGDVTVGIIRLRGMPLTPTAQVLETLFRRELAHL